MSGLTDKAAKGNRAALTALYEKNRSKVYAVCSALLRDDKSAANAATWALRNGLMSLGENKPASEEQFGESVLLKAVGYCKRLMTKKNSRALRAPESWELGEVKTGGAAADANAADVLLDNLPGVQRMLCALPRLAGLSDAQTAAAADLDLAAVRQARLAEEGNVRKVLAALGRDESVDLDALFRQKAGEAVLPAASEAQILAQIDAIAAPTEKKSRKKTVLIAAIAAAAALALLVTGLLLAFSGGGSAAGGDLSAEITVEKYGTITVALDAKAAPKTVENFVSLAESGFYDGLTFHRIMDGFMMQGGDPSHNGTGGSGTNIFGEFSLNGFENNLHHTRGAISMARNSFDYNSASSQFFIVQSDSTASLDGGYAAFGYVTSGMEIVDAICADARPTDSNGTIPFEEQPVITSIRIIRAGEAK